jgi:hypothetical protein
MARWRRRAALVGIFAALAGAGAAWAGALWEEPAGGDPAPVVRAEAGAADRARLEAAATRAATRRAAVRARLEETSPTFMVREGKQMPLPKELAALFPGRRVTVDIDKGTATAAAAAIGKAAQVAIKGEQSTTFEQADIPEVTLHLKDAPLVEAVLQLCSQAGLRVRTINAAQVTLGRNEKGLGVGVWCTAGPAAVVLESIVHEVDLRANPQPERFDLGLAVFVEPGVTVLAYPRGITFGTMADETELSLVPAKEEGREEEQRRQRSRAVAAPSMGVGRITLPLAPPAGAGQKIAILRGTVDVVVGLKNEKVTLTREEADVGAEREIAGMKVTIAPLKQQNSYYVSSVSYEKGSMDDGAWAKIKKGLVGVPAVVLDQGGVALQVFNAPNASDNENSVTVAQQYYAGGGSQTRVPRRVELEVPTEVQVLPLPVEFKDLVLP